MNLTIQQVEFEIETLDMQIRPLADRRAEMERELRRLKSVEFIKANNITRDDVEMSSGDGKPWWGTVVAFGNWLRETGCQKRFCEWNHGIYFTSDAINGRWDHNLPGRIEDLNN